MPKQNITRSRLKELLNYDIATGQFRWNQDRRNGRTKAGDIAGCLVQEGYIHIALDGKTYKAHKLAWFYFYGRWPTKHIDHRNGDRADNRLGNLREADRFEQMQNLKTRSGSKTSQYPGVGRSGKKWWARIQYKNVSHYLGQFDSEEEAYAAYLDAKAKLHSYQPIPRERLRGPLYGTAAVPTKGQTS
jgi:hypothetical protein